MLPQLREITAVQGLLRVKRYLPITSPLTLRIGRRDEDPQGEDSRDEIARDEDSRDGETAIRKVLCLQGNPTIRRVPYL
jgi:hypothetical protein